MKTTKIISNKAKCLICGETIESTFTHDFKSCKCGNITVDGGHDYLRRSSVKPDKMVDLSEVKVIEE